MQLMLDKDKLLKDAQAKRRETEERVRSLSKAKEDAEARATAAEGELKGLKLMQAAEEESSKVEVEKAENAKRNSLSEDAEMDSVFKLSMHDSNKRLVTTDLKIPIITKPMSVDPHGLPSDNDTSSDAFLEEGEEKTEALSPAVLTHSTTGASEV